jgi:hypothetical protein
MPKLASRRMAPGLTVLSLLARLGEDPWSVLKRWVALPKAKIIDELVPAWRRCR